jgi:drug/metabolite transporter (DMT)-like permease
VLSLTVVTLISRLTLFLGVKHIGGIQTAILGLGELFVTIVFSFYFLHETLTILQMLGATILGTSILLISLEKHDHQRKHPKGGWLAWIHPPEVSVPWSLQD